MKSNINDKAEEVKGKDEETAVEQRNDVKFEAEGACERIAGKNEEEACKIKMGV
jgi:hypothetical protein